MGGGATTLARAAAAFPKDEGEFSLAAAAGVSAVLAPACSLLHGDAFWELGSPASCFQLLQSKGSFFVQENTIEVLCSCSIHLSGVGHKPEPDH